MNFPDEGNDPPITEILATDIIFIFLPLGGIDCVLNVWILASRNFLMFCKKLNTFQKTYHMHYVDKVSIHINYLRIS